MEVRYYYPYCGYELGFCTLGSPCELPYGNHASCEYLRKFHPLTGNRPQNIYSQEGLEEVEYMEEDDTD